MPIRTYVDTNVLIAAFKAHRPTHAAALEVLADEERELVGSQYLELEVLPGPRRRDGDADEREFMERTLGRFVETLKSGPDVTTLAVDLAARYELKPLDALHAAIALHYGVDEFVTTEAANKPFFRVPGLRCRSLAPPPAVPTAAAGDPLGSK